MRELLVRYLLGELDPYEQAELEERLDNCPELRRELEYLQRCFSAGGEYASEARQPPSGLAERTAERIAGLVDGALESCGDSRRDHAAALVEPAPGKLNWSLADLTVAAGVCLAVTMLLLPALRESRDSTRRRECQNNLRQLYVLLTDYAEYGQHRRYFPPVAPDENAGIFSARLVDQGITTPEELANLLVCRSSPLADEVMAGRVVIRIPAVAQLRYMRPDELAELRRVMGGSYAYRIGYLEGRRYHYIRRDGSKWSPLVADAPSFQLAGFRSANHGGCGQHVLYQDGHVRYQRDCKVPGRDDHLYLNDLGTPAAGCGVHDAVLARSEVVPALELARQAQ